MNGHKEIELRKRDGPSNWILPRGRQASALLLSEPKFTWSCGVIHPDNILAFYQRDNKVSFFNFVTDQWYDQTVEEPSCIQHCVVCGPAKMSVRAGVPCAAFYFLVVTSTYLQLYGLSLRAEELNAVELDRVDLQHCVAFSKCCAAGSQVFVTLQDEGLAVARVAFGDCFDIESNLFRPKEVRLTLIPIIDEFGRVEDALRRPPGLIKSVSSVLSKAVSFNTEAVHLLEAVRCPDQLMTLLCVVPTPSYKVRVYVVSPLGDVECRGLMSFEELAAGKKNERLATPFCGEPHQLRIECLNAGLFLLRILTTKGYESKTIYNAHTNEFVSLPLISLVAPMMYMVDQTWYEDIRLSPPNRRLHYNVRKKIGEPKVYSAPSFWSFGPITVAQFDVESNPYSFILSLTTTGHDDPKHKPSDSSPGHRSESEEWFSTTHSIVIDDELLHVAPVRAWPQLRFGADLIDLGCSNLLRELDNEDKKPFTDVHACLLHDDQTHAERMRRSLHNKMALSCPSHTLIASSTADNAFTYELLLVFKRSIQIMRVTWPRWLGNYSSVFYRITSARNDPTKIVLPISNTHETCLILQQLYGRLEEQIRGKPLFEFTTEGTLLYGEVHSLLAECKTLFDALARAHAVDEQEVPEEEDAQLERSSSRNQILGWFKRVRELLWLASIPGLEMSSSNDYSVSSLLSIPPIIEDVLMANMGRLRLPDVINHMPSFASSSLITRWLMLITPDGAAPQPHLVKECSVADQRTALIWLTSIVKHVMENARLMDMETWMVDLVMARASPTQSMSPTRALWLDCDFSELLKLAFRYALLTDPPSNALMSELIGHFWAPRDAQRLAVMTEQEVAIAREVRREWLLRQCLLEMTHFPLWSLQLESKSCPSGTLASMFEHAAQMTEDCKALIELNLPLEMSIGLSAVLIRGHPAEQRSVLAVCLSLCWLQRILEGSEYADEETCALIDDVRVNTRALQSTRAPGWAADLMRVQMEADDLDVCLDHNGDVRVTEVLRWLDWLRDEKGWFLGQVLGDVERPLLGASYGELMELIEAKKWVSEERASAVKLACLAYCWPAEWASSKTLPYKVEKDWQAQVVAVDLAAVEAEFPRVAGLRAAISGHPRVCAVPSSSAHHS